MILFESYLKTRIDESSAKMYRNAVAKWLNEDHVDPHTQRDAQAYVDGYAKTHAPATANIVAHAILRWFRWKGHPIELEMQSVSAPKPDYRSMEQINILINACHTLLEKVLVIVLFDTAVRISELLNLKIDGINWEQGFISVIRKGGRPDQVNISPRALAVLRGWVNSRAGGGESDERVFMGLTYHDAWRIIRNVGLRAGIAVHPHVFRHSRAIQMLKAGAKPYIVMQHLGHLRLATTMEIYGKFIVTDLKEEIPPWE
jgi:integrase